MKMVVAAISVIGPVIATSAFAADMAVKVPPSPPVPVFSWTGPYAGLALGAKWADTTWTTLQR